MTDNWTDARRDGAMRYHTGRGDPFSGGLGRRLSPASWWERSPSLLVLVALTPAAVVVCTVLISFSR